MCGPAIIPIAAAAAGAGGAAIAGASTAAIVGMGVMGAASGLQAVSNIQASEYNQKLAEQQQKQINAEAENVRIAGSQEAGRAYIENQQAAARGRAEFGGRGISSVTGTPSAALQDVADVGTLEQMTIVNNASRQAFGMEVQGQNLVDQAKIKAKSARRAGFSTILGSAASGYTSGLTMGATV